MAYSAEVSPVLCTNLHTMAAKNVQDCHREAHLLLLLKLLLLPRKEVSSVQLDVKDRLYTLEHFVPYLLLYKGVASSTSPVPCRRGWISRLPFAPCYAFGIQVSCTQRPSLRRIVRLVYL